MKRIIIAVLLISSIAYAQHKVKNGIIYKQHPYITAVKQLAALYANADVDGMASYFAADAQIYGMKRYNPDSTIITRLAAKGKTLTEAKAGWQYITDTWESIRMKLEGSPDGLQYANAMFTVQSWWQVTLINKNTKKTAIIEMVLYDMFNKSGKIAAQIEYYDPAPMLAASK
jgi:hypothetical protein